MKKVLAVVFAAAFLCVASFGAQAQVPYAQVYFDDTFQQTQADCPGMGVQQFMYLVYHNVNAFISSTQFKITYPAAMIFLGDATTAPVKIGNSGGGAYYGWPIPLNGYSSVLICSPFIQWNCADCSGGPGAIVVGGIGPNPGQELKVGTYPDASVEIELIGMTSLVCPVGVPTRTETWGAIKSLYSE
jgi:hypothetical protein